MGQVDIVVPAFNEAVSIPVLYERLSAMAAGEKKHDFRFLIVDDGSKDETPNVVRKLSMVDPRVKLYQLSRNFGHQAALSAGLDHADGDAVIFLDADLQHPPEVVPTLLRKWEEGAQIVDTKRIENNHRAKLSGAMSNTFYRVINLLSEVQLEQGTGDFRLLDRSAANALRQVKERARFLRGLVQWIGFRHALVEYLPESRFAGETKFSFSSLLRLAFDGLYSFSSVPLRVATWLGGITTSGAFLYGLYVLYEKFFTDNLIAGWTSLMVVTLFIGGATLVVLGILGGYIGRIYEEVRARPVYLLQEQPPQKSAIVAQLVSPVSPLKPTPTQSPPV
ncbi:MAG TPA: glycosyltransferase family 2 protein [Kofleriaceae bacterium]|jgi:dolichol-phosphate mannosyltransferase